MISPFKNEPLTDFAKPENRQAMRDALANVRAQFGKKYPIIIGDKELYLDAVFESTNPAHPREVIGVMSQAEAEHARQAIEIANGAFESWKHTSPKERAELLLNVASLMRERKHLISAWNIYEVGKPWSEADGETAETIDFFEYYARQMVRLEDTAPKSLSSIPSERNTFRYLPLGVGVVIPPWNFPIAQLVGLTSAAIVAGNTVVLKPASASPVTGYQVVKLFYEAGIPAGVLNFVTGPGGIIGDTLVEHPKTRFIGFTGSKEVGIRINEKAARMQPGQKWIKRCILEMGGKNAVVVDETADLDAAAEGIVVSAFSYQGQKCSAGSRAIIVKDVYDNLVDLVVQRASKISIGDPAELDTALGPVIDENARKKIMEYVDIGRKEGQLILGGESLDDKEGYFIFPTIFKDVPWNARIAQEEIFGPVLTIIKAEDFDDALRVANSTEYGLTGSLYSKDREHIERAAAEFHVGNLYFNRKSVGAEVGIHPFGGFNMSGTDSKAGGPDYLLLFTQAKSVSEKL